MKKFFDLVNSSISRRLFMYFLLIALLPLLTVQLITTIINEQTLTKVVLSSAEAEVSSALISMERSFSSIISVCDSIQNDATFQKRMRSSYDTLADRYSEELAGDMDLASMAGIHPEIYGLYLLGANQLCCKSNSSSFLSNDYRSNAWFYNTIATRTSSWTNFHEGSYVVKTSPELFISYCCPYIDKATGRANGVIVVDVEEDTLTSAFSLDMQDGFFLLLDSGNEPLYLTNSTPENEALVSKVVRRITAAEKISQELSLILTDRDCLIVCHVSSITGWKLVSVIPMAQLNATRNMNTWLAIFISVLFTLLALFLSSYLSNHFTAPFLQIQAAMKAVEEGDFSIALMPVGKDELADLTGSFNRMVQQLQELVNSVYEQQAQLRKSEFKALQAQINPHFLYNSLDSIVWLMRMDRVNDAITMLQNLTTLFRISLSKGRELIPLRSELRHLNSYLTIESMRYSRKFEAAVDVDEQLLDYTSLKLMLQPLVENCIYHSISVEKPFIHIRISVAQTERELLFRVEDDGIGMTPEELQALRDKIAVTPQVRNSSAPVDPYSDSGGYGLKNVNERIKIYFGDAYGITIESEEKVGTSVNIRIPKMRKHDP